MDYPKYLARFYDIIYDSMRSEVDTDYYLKEISKARGRILEIGVGTGRFFTAALKNSADIYGIDVSKSMIDILLKKIEPSFHNRVSIQNAVDFKFPFRFNLILAPFRIFSHLLSVQDQLSALNNIYDHLEENGRLIFDLYVPDPALTASGMNNYTDFQGEYEPGKKLSRTVSMKADIVNQISDITMTFKWDEDGREEVRKWNFKFRFYFRYELEHLINRSKLTLKKIYGDFEGGELKEGSKEFIVVCCRS
jgi:SAM-dependent methyltransferase